MLAQAKLGILAAAIVSPLVAWIVFRLIARVPATVRARQLGRTAEQLIDLAEDVDPARDHIRGAHDAPVTLVEYGDFECPYCGRAEPAIRELLAEWGDDLRYVFRHLPLSDVHPWAQLAAEASEAAGAQGAFWEMYDILLAHQGELTPGSLRRYAQELGLDGERLRPRNCAGAPMRRASARTWRAPTPAASRGRRRSSSTDAATPASTTSRRSAPPCGGRDRAYRPHPGTRERMDSLCRS